MSHQHTPETALSEEEVFEQKRVRLEKRDRLNAGAALGGGAYPVTVPVTATIPEVRAKWGSLEATPDSQSGETVGIAGRVVFQRNTGKLCFASLQAGDGSRIQAMVSLAEVGEESLARYKEFVDLGDHLFVSGEVISSRRGELSIMVRQWQIAAKALAPLPNMYAELNEETRVRQRYLDLIQREQARANVVTRAKTMASLRQTFAERGFIEVETPMLQTMHGGASARPFVTHSNAFDTELFLRIAPELFLKRAVVGGLDRVFEINRNFRNEGADSTHSPEFAMLESYQAYTDYHGIADLTQALVQNAALAVNVGTERAGTQEGIVKRVSDKAGLSYETIDSLKGVEQLDKLSRESAVVLTRGEGGRLSESGRRDPLQPVQPVCLCDVDRATAPGRSRGHRRGPRRSLRADSHPRSHLQRRRTALPSARGTARPLRRTHAACVRGSSTRRGRRRPQGDRIAGVGRSPGRRVLHGRARASRPAGRA